MKLSERALAKIKILFILVSIYVLFSFSVSVSLAQEIDDAVHIPGSVEGTGKHFEINDSEYLNIRLDSSEEISASIESIPKMVTIIVNQTESADNSKLIISGLNPNTTYYKYEDDYTNLEPFSTDENGLFSFNLDISRDRLIIIQPRKSTKILKNDATGYDCAGRNGIPGIGIWDFSSKTCTLTKNVNETIQINDDGITLDGANYASIGLNTGYAVLVSGRNSIIKNLRISNFSSGIYLKSSSNTADSITATTYGSGVIVDSNDNTVKNSYLLQNQKGISQAKGENNLYENNTITSNGYGISLSGGSKTTVKNNIISKNLFVGMETSIPYNYIYGNKFIDNLDWPLFISGYMLATNDVDDNNIIDDKPVRYYKNIDGQTFESLDMGLFYCINCSNITVRNNAFAKNSRLYLGNNHNTLVENEFSEKTLEITLDGSSENTIRKSDFNNIRLLYSSNNNKFYNNNIFADYNAVIIASSVNNIFYENLPTGGNYWSLFSRCQDSNNDGICDSQYVINSSYNAVDKYPYKKPISHEPPPPPCCSSVMFLPGHQASRLYKKDANGVDQLWEPTNHNEDIEQLYMDENGESVDSEIYARGVVDEIYGFAGNVYKGFMDSMDQFVADGSIKEWKPVAYDWRLPLEKIATDGVNLENGAHMDIVSEIERMAAASKTGKVTLIGHSNGGLLAKVLIDRLKEKGEEKLVDRLIMVGTPQLGTPKAMAALLHGDETSLLGGLILDGKTGRGFAENMASAYNLLPSREYFNDVQSPVAEFDEDVKNIYDFRSIYGDNISGWNEFKKFLLGDNGARTEPAASDLDSPNVLRKKLLDESEATHEKLDSWQAPEGMEVVQIAGWGLDTIRGIKYDDCDIPFCPDKLSNLDRSILLAQDGDGTVVVPSAVEMGGEAERYYLNVKNYNKGYLFGLVRNRDHADILEVEPLQNFIKNIIKGDKTLTDFITTTKPEVKAEDKRLRFTLHSPVSIDLYDKNGNHTGLIKNLNFPDPKLFEEQIPNSYYLEFGEKKYAGAGDTPVDIKLTGEDLGTFTFDVDRVAGDKVENTTTFSDIPVMKNTTANLSVSETVSEMKIDVDADGQNDATFHPGEKISKADLLGIFEKIVSTLNVEKTEKNRLINKIDNAKKQMEKGNVVSSNAMLENVKQQIGTFSRNETPEKFLISQEEAEKLIGIIEKIQAIE